MYWFIGHNFKSTINLRNKIKRLLNYTYSPSTPYFRNEMFPNRI